MRPPAPPEASSVVVDEAFERLARLAARLFGAPATAIAVVAPRSLDAGRADPIGAASTATNAGLRWRVRLGLDGSPTEAEAAFVRQVVAEKDLVVTEDAGSGDGAPSRFFAGAPLLGPGGACLGALAIIDIDTKGRTWTSADRELLQELAAIAAGQVLLAAGGGTATSADDELPPGREERLASLATLAAGVAHEINNPLTYIMANIGFVAERLTKLQRQTPSDAEARDGEAGEAPSPPTGELKLALDELKVALTEAQEGAVRIRQIVRDLKVFAWADQEQYAPIDIRPVIEAAVAMAGPEVRTRARLVKSLAPVPPVEASESRLGQLFLNLLLNAAQAIKEGHPGDNEIRISTEVDGAGRVVATVADTGAGIPPELIRRIFDPFFTTKPLGVGIGLGLFICQGVVKALGGELIVQSELGRGSRFSVVLPPAR